MAANSPGAFVPPKPAAVIVLAAGEGKRMKSKTPKMLHEFGGRSLVGHCVAAARALEPEHLAVVVGHGRDRVSAYLNDFDDRLTIAVQDQQNGTGDAVRVALDALPALHGSVVVTLGDVPLLRPETLAALLTARVETGAAAVVLTGIVPDPTGYGRILRDTDGQVAGIVEHKDASPDQLEIDEINSGIFAFDVDELADALSRVKADNAQGEEYLTDVLGILRADGKTVTGVVAADTADIFGVNDRVQLAQVHRIHNERLLEAWMRAGVTILDPRTTWIDATVTLEPDVTIRPQTSLHGTTTVATGASIGPDTTLIDTTVGAGARVVRAHSDGAVIGPDTDVGPYAYLRPGTRLGTGSKIGTFVEAKNAEVGDGAKVPHLTYVGDATIGAGSNIGAGTIFANYDGVNKHHTTVGEHSFVGSDSVLVAPVELADGTYVAAGSTVTMNVDSGALAVARGRQRNIDGWVARRRAGTRTAAAAERAKSDAPKSDATDGQ